MQNCPHCNQPIRETNDFCLFCSASAGRGRKLSVRYNANAPRETRTFAGKAQRVLGVLSLLAFSTCACAVLLSPPTARQLASADPLTLTIANTFSYPTATSVQPLQGQFAYVNGAYDISLALSVADSENPDTLSAAEGIRGDIFPGIVSIKVDENGVGTLSIQQMFLSPEEISVSPFTNTEGVASSDTLYGYITHAGMKLSVVCVCEDQSISGFIWMDSADTHIEFLYYS